MIRGVLFHPLQFENLFVSLVHDDRDIDDTLNAAADALTVVARTRRPAIGSVSGAVLLGVDLGTSAIKAVALGEDGTVLGVARREYPTARPEPGAAEQDPHHWFTAFEAAITDLALMVPADSWAGMGLSAMLPTLVDAIPRRRRSGPPSRGRTPGRNRRPPLCGLPSATTRCTASPDNGSTVAIWRPCTRACIGSDAGARWWRGEGRAVRTPDR